MNKTILFGLGAVVLLLAIGSVAFETSASATTSPKAPQGITGSKLVSSGTGWFVNDNPHCKMTKSGARC
jgi:hypothetical protein